MAPRPAPETAPPVPTPGYAPFTTRPPAVWVGSALWLDFVNTRYVWRDEPVDALPTFAALVDWLAEAGALPRDEAVYLARRLEGTSDADAVLREAVELRAALLALAAALAVDAPRAKRDRAADDAAAAINRVLRAAVSYPELVASGGGGSPRRARTYTRRLHPIDDDPRRVLTPIAESAAQLLTSGDAAVVRRCGNPKCVLHFQDTTKNRNRRFCSAAGCGNRVKAAARYRRQRGAR